MNTTPTNLAAEEPFDSFDYHTPSPAQAARLAENVSFAKGFRASIQRLPNGREKALALTNLEQALMWANKAAMAPPPPAVPASR